MPERDAYLLGLDAGNTVIKAVLFDCEGRTVASHARDGQTATPTAGHVERDLNELWANAQIVIRRCVDDAGIEGAQIRAVGCAGHGNGLYLLDRQQAPLLGVQSLDGRGAKLAAELSARSGDALHALCLQKPWPSQTPVLLAWIRQHQPEVFAQAGTVFLCKDFIAFKLTGELASDISDMSGCGLAAMPACAYSDELLALYGLEDAKPMLPRLVTPDEIAGWVTAEAAKATGLAEGTPVVGGLIDVVASAIGSGAIRAGDASIIAGTWSINQVFTARPVVDDSVFMVAGFGDGRFSNIDASATSAANLEWYVREFVEGAGRNGNPFDYVNAKIAEVEPAIDDPIYHPFLFGSAEGAEFRAGFYGIAGWHGEAHLLRGIFEGVLFEHRRHIGVLKTAGVLFDRAILSGGGSRSPIWAQMFADCLGVPISVAACSETGALGAAIAAGVGVGQFADYEEGVAVMTCEKQVFTPTRAMRAHYDSRYKIYRDLVTSMGAFWRAHAEARADCKDVAE